jgi:hypothetical protein
VNYLITDAAKHRRRLYLAALDCKDAFGSAFHQLMGINLEEIGVPKRLNKMIMDSYRNTQVRIYINDSTSEHIDIKKGIKQSCP